MPSNQPISNVGTHSAQGRGGTAGPAIAADTRGYEAWSDSELVEAVASRDEDAFVELLSRHKPSAERYVAASIRCPADADAVIQELDYEVWKKASKFDSDRGAFQTFYWQIVKSRVIDYFRKALRSPEINQVIEDLAGSADPKSEDDFIRIEEQEEKRRLLTMIFEAVGPQHAITLKFELDHGCEVTEEDVKTELGISWEAYRQRRSRALRAVRSIASRLNADEGEEETTA